MSEPGLHEFKDKIPQETYERKPPKNREELYQLVKETISEGKRVALIADFDRTQSKDNKDSESPFDTELDPDCAKHQLSLQNDGVVIGVVSNRAAGQITERFKKAGFSHPPLTIGTYGYEETDSEGKASIPSRWAWNRYSNAIKHVLESVRKKVMQEYGINFDPAVETTIQSPDKNPIYLEMKGLDTKFPEGLAQVYNLNSVPPEKRIGLVKQMNNTVDEALAEYAGADPKKKLEVEELSTKWGGKETKALESAAEPGGYSWSLEPTHKYNKTYGMAHLWEKIEKQSHEPLGLVVYAGDHHHQDGVAMWYGKLREQTMKGKTKFVGILVNKEQKGSENDMTVNDVPDFADLLSGLADAVHEVRETKSSQTDTKKTTRKLTPPLSKHK